MRGPWLSSVVCVHLLGSDLGVRLVGNERTLTLNRCNASVREHGILFHVYGGFHVKAIRTVENMVDCLGVGDP